MITRGKLAEQTGCNIETIRYYEKIGLLPDPERTAARYRIYNQDYVKRLRFILKAKALGVSTERVQNLLTITYGSETHTRSEVKYLTETHIQEVSAKTRDLLQKPKKAAQ